MALNPDGGTVANGSWQDATIRLWDADTGKHLRTFNGNTNGVQAVAVISSARSTLDIKLQETTETNQQRRIGTAATRTANPSQAASITINSGQAITPRCGGWRLSSSTAHSGCETEFFENQFLKLLRVR